MKALSTVLILSLVTSSFMWVNIGLYEFLNFESIKAIGRFIDEFFPPNLEKTFLTSVAIALYETLAMSILGTFFATIFGLTIAYMIVENKKSVLDKFQSSIFRGLLNILRSIPEVVWAAILIISAGLGPFTGCLAIIIHTTGVLGRLFTDAFENCTPISSRTLRVNGCSFFQGFIYGKFFQLTPQIISYVLYRWENNIRVASILGIVGAGGLGQLLTFNLGLFLMDKAATVIIATMILIVIVDGLSSTIRRSLN